VTDRTEDNFKEALKTLVMDEPEKLDFFDGADKGAIPPFVPFVYEEIKEDTRTKVVSINAGRRRRNMFGMLAAAACSLVFVFAAAINFNTDIAGQTPIGGGAAPDSAITMPAPGDDDEEIARGIVAPDAAEDAEESVTNTFPLLVAGAIIFAGLFLLLFIQRRRLSLL